MPLGITWMVKNNTFSQSGILTGDGSAPGYDFNNGAQGWTFSNSYSGRVTTPSCGYNGSSGGSIRTYAGSTHATSPATNLAGRTNIPFHAWVHEGRSGCGETPIPVKIFSSSTKLQAVNGQPFTPSKGADLKPAISSIRQSCPQRRSFYIAIPHPANFW